MLKTTVSRLRCPLKKRGSSVCGGELDVRGEAQAIGTESEALEIHTGELGCRICRGKFPVLGGVAILVEDVGAYILGHVKGISQIVADDEIPAEFRDDFLEAKDEIEVGHIEDDLEAERVTSLYLMNHYLKVEGTDPAKAWWKPRAAEASPLIDQLVREHWDSGPFARIENWVSKLPRGGALPALVELGCGVGGLHRRLRSHLSSYLGIDSSFASIALARHLALGAAYPGRIRIPEDLLHGGVSREIKLPVATQPDSKVDFIVADLEGPCLKPGHWDVSVALNTIDMLDEPADLPKLQKMVLKKDGIAIQSCPYVWHPQVAQRLRSRLPREIKDSAKAVEWLYENAGFEIEERIEHAPWLFFKHVRQLEIYSVHLFLARVGGY